MENKKKNKPLALTIGGSALFSVILVLAIFPAINAVEQNSILGEDVAHFKGVITMIHSDKDGNVLSYQQMENLIPNEGLECTADLLFGTTSCVGEAFFQFLAIGTSAIAPADGDLALGAESGTCARVQDATPTLTLPASGIRAITLTSVFTGATCEGQTFAETGVFDASTSGNMLARTLLSSTVTLTSGDSLTINYEVRLNN